MCAKDSKEKGYIIFVWMPFLNQSSGNSVSEIKKIEY